jgi:hypothetical protein
LFIILNFLSIPYFKDKKYFVKKIFYGIENNLYFHKIIR